MWALATRLLDKKKSSSILKKCFVQRIYMEKSVRPKCPILVYYSFGVIIDGHPFPYLSHIHPLCDIYLLLLLLKKIDLFNQIILSLPSNWISWNKYACNSLPPSTLSLSLQLSLTLCNSLSQFSLSHISLADLSFSHLFTDICDETADNGSWCDWRMRRKGDDGGENRRWNSGDEGYDEI